MQVFENTMGIGDPRGMNREYYGLKETLDPDTLSQTQPHAGMGNTMGDRGSQGDE